MAPDELTRRVAEALEPLDAVRVAWVFGSRIAGGATDRSDLDVAVVLPRALDGAGREGVRRAVVRVLTAMNEALRELERPGAGDARALASDVVLRAAVERWLQIAIEASIDVADHVIASEGWTPPASARAAFASLAAHGRLPLDLADRLGDAAGLRNVLVHDYVAVDLGRLAATVREDLGELRAFAAHAAVWMAPRG